MRAFANVWRRVLRFVRRRPRRDRVLISDASAFATKLEAHRGELRLHAYRMLGSSHDSDDVVQETFIRALRGRGALDDPSKLRAWLYRIATNVCLDELGKRPKRQRAYDLDSTPSGPTEPYAADNRDVAWLEPCPSTWLSSTAAGVEVLYTAKESVALAFVAALQSLTPSQRATLLLRDVVGLSAQETASALSVTVEAANSALFRARTFVQTRAFEPNDRDVDPALLLRYLRAWEDSDVDAFVALLHDEVKTTMPPAPTWIFGRDDNATFCRAMFAQSKPGLLRIVMTSANGGPAFAFYRAAASSEPHTLRAVHVIGLKNGAIIAIDHFMLPEIFARFDLPRELPR